MKELCALVHNHGGRVYVDGANMNALVGLAAPGRIWRRREPPEPAQDLLHSARRRRPRCRPGVCGGRPGALSCRARTGGVGNGGAVSAAPLGNAAVLPISWMYCRMMGADGLQAATEAAILSANYISVRLKDHYPTLYASANGQTRSCGARVHSGSAPLRTAVVVSTA